MVWVVDQCSLFVFKKKSRDCPRGINLYYDHALRSPHLFDGGLASWKTLCVVSEHAAQKDEHKENSLFE